MSNDVPSNLVALARAIEKIVEINEELFLTQDNNGDDGFDFSVIREVNIGQPLEDKLVVQASNALDNAACKIAEILIALATQEFKT